jgi:hypothetical protein
MSNINTSAKTFGLACLAAPSPRERVQRCGAVSGVTFAPRAVELESIQSMSSYRHMLEGVVGTVSAQTGGVDERLRRRRVQERDELDRSPYALAFEGRFGQAYNEEAFRYFLDIERRRSAVSNLPFLLLLIDLKKQLELNARVDTVAGRLFSALSTCVRETDFIGWYHEGRVAGAVLTQHGDAAVRDVPDIVRQRITAALRDALSPESAGRVDVSVYQLPASTKGDVNE